MLTTAAWPACLTATLLTLTGCSTLQRQTSAYRTVPDAARSAQDHARQANALGLQHASAKRYAAAEAAFRKALAADIGYAAAHNNLAIVLAATGDLYQAALECAFAIRLEPRAVAPRLTLGQIYERAPGGGWTREALRAYEEALALEPKNIEVIGHLARVCVKDGIDRPELAGWLDALMTSGRPEWWLWATRQHAADRSQPAAADHPTFDH